MSLYRVDNYVGIHTRFIMLEKLLYKCNFYTICLFLDKDRCLKNLVLFYCTENICEMYIRFLLARLHKFFVLYIMTYNKKNIVYTGKSK